MHLFRRCVFEVAFMKILYLRGYFESHLKAQGKWSTEKLPYRLHLKKRLLRLMSLQGGAHSLSQTRLKPRGIK